MSDKKGLNQGTSKKFEIVMAAAIAIVVISVVLAIAVYRSKFAGGLSSISDDWSNFGSYIGGVFGPVISFFTLLAVLKTVYLQRELLHTQRREFTSLSNQQERIFELQDNQLRLAVRQSDKTELLGYQVAQLRMVEQMMSYYQRAADAKGQMAIKVLNLGGNPAKRQAEADQLILKKEKLELAVYGLLLLSIDLSVKEFSSINELKELVSKQMGSALSSIIEGGAV